MFEISGLEILVIAIVALLVLGPEKFPHAAVKCARLFNQLRRGWVRLQRQLFLEINLEDEARRKKKPAASSEIIEPVEKIHPAEEISPSKAPPSDPGARRP